MGRIALQPPTFPDNPDATEYFRQLHQLISGTGPDDNGNLNEENLSTEGFDILHGEVAGNHSDMQQAADPGNATISGLEITTDDAGITYNAFVQALINEMKADYNLLVAEHNALVQKFNALLAALRAANGVG